MENFQDQHPITVLNVALQACVGALRLAPSNHEALEQKRALDEALRVLHWARRLSISGREKALLVPMGRTKTPSSELRVVEDNESDDRRFWTEVALEGERLRLYPGDIIVRK